VIFAGGWRRAAPCSRSKREEPMTRFAVAFVAGAAAVLAAGAAQAQAVIASWTPQDVIPLLQNLNVTVTRQTTLDDGAPSLEVRSQNGFNFIVDGTVCEEANAQRCTGARIVAYFDFNDRAAAQQAVDQLDYALVSLDATSDGDLRVLRYVILDYGVTPANFQENLRYFIVVGEEISQRLNAPK
jgi:hypothetical protein